MSEEPRALPVMVAVTPALFPSHEAAAAAVRQRTEAELSELLGGLGVARRPEVDFRKSEPQPATPLMTLHVGGRPCRFPATTIGEALAYIDRTPQVTTDAADLLGRLRDSDGSGPERLGELIACVCRAAVSAQPGIALAADEDAALRAAISLGMSVANREDVSPEPSSGSGDLAERLIAAAAGKTIDVRIDPAYLRVLTVQDSAEELFGAAREGLFTELGLPLPPFRLRPDESLGPAAFAFQVNSVLTIPQIGLPVSTILVNDTPERLALQNVEAHATINPATHQPGALAGHEHKDTLEAQGLTTWDAFGFLILSFAAAVRRSAHALMTRDVAASMTEKLGWAFPVLGEAARAHVPPHVLAPVLRELLLDGVQIRNLRRIVELLLRFETAGTPGRFPDRIAFVRSGLADQIASRSARGTDTVVVYLIDPALEAAVADHGDGLDTAGGDDPLAERFSAAVRAELSHLPPTAQVPALLTRDELRRPVQSLVRREFPQMRVLAHGDLPPSFNVQPVARISAE